MKRSEAAQVLVAVRTLWPHAKVIPDDVTAEQAATTWATVLDVPVSDAIAAVVAIAHGGDRFPPTVGQIRAAVVTANTPTIPDVDEVWAEIIDRANRVGLFTAECEAREGRDALQWTHPVVGQVVKALGGWRAVCMSDAGDPVVRAQARQAYLAAAARAVRDQAEAGSVDWSRAIGAPRLRAIGEGE